MKTIKYLIIHLIICLIAIQFDLKTSLLIISGSLLLTWIGIDIQSIMNFDVTIKTKHDITIEDE